jgi:hypothetical protein
MLFLAVTAVAQKSVTVDEYQALPHGLAILRTGDFHLATGVQPLASVLPALAVSPTSARLDTSHFADETSTWALGRQFLQENAAGYHYYFMVGRLVSAAVLLLTALLAYGFARSLYGPAGGLLTAVFVCFAPNLLAHGPLITPDVYLTAGLLGSLWAFDALLRRPGWRTALLLGLALGAACLAKLTALLLFVILPPVLLAFQIADHYRAKTEPAEATPGRRTWLAAAGAGLVGLLVVNAGYLFAGTGTPLGDFAFQSGPFRQVQQALPAWLPVPLPAAYFRGLDAQLAEEGYLAYLLGRFNQQGFWHYYLVGLLVKTPLVVLALCGLAWLCGRGVRRREVALLATAGVLFVFFSLARHKNIGMRYLLFLEPMMAVWVGRLAASPCWTAPAYRRRLRAVTAAAGAWLVVTALATWPDYLAYFNPACGGPSKGHKYLLDSNLDWGQDLIALRRYMDREGIDVIDLAYFGRVDPKVYGIRYRNFRAGPEEKGPDATPARYVAISANLLWGRLYLVNGGDHWLTDRNAYADFRLARPKAVLGHTIYVYDREDEHGPP